MKILVTTNPPLLIETTMILSNLLIDPEILKEFQISNGTSSFLQLLHLKNSILTEHAIWGLANIAGGTIESRNSLFDLKIDHHIIEYLNQFDKISQCSSEIRDNLAWLICNLVREPVKIFDKMKEFIPVLLDLMNECKTEGVVHVLKALVLMTAYDDVVMYLGEYIKIERFRYTFKKLMAFSVQRDNVSLQFNAFRILGNFVASSNNFLIPLFNQGFLSIIRTNLQTRSNMVRTDACWILSNIFASSNTFVFNKISKIEYKKVNGKTVPSGLPLDLIEIA